MLKSDFTLPTLTLFYHVKNLILYIYVFKLMTKKHFKVLHYHDQIESPIDYSGG